MDSGCRLEGKFEELLNDPNSMANQLTGQGTFKDTGRQSSGPAEAVDSIIGAPARLLVDEAVKGNLSWDTVTKVFHQIGADPELAPTGKQIVAQLTDYTDIQDLLGRALDMGLQLPGTEFITPGVVGEIRGVKHLGKVADAVEAFAAKAKQAPSLETKIAQMHGQTGEVRSAMEPLLNRAGKEHRIAEQRSVSMQEAGEGINSGRWGHNSNSYDYWPRSALESSGERSGRPVVDPDYAKIPQPLGSLGDAAYTPGPHEIIPGEKRSLHGGPHGDVYKKTDNLGNSEFFVQDRSGKVTPFKSQEEADKFYSSLIPTESYAHGGTVAPTGFAPKHMPMLSQQEYQQMTQLPPGFKLDETGSDLPPGFELDEDKYGGMSGAAASAGLGLLSGASLGASDVALTKSGLMKPETIRGYQETNPGSHFFGEVGSLLIPTGAVGALGKVGKGVYRGAKALSMMRAAEEAGVVGKMLKGGADIGAQALGSAVEGALYAGTQQTLNEFALGDPDLNSEKILSHYGQGALFGGAMGGALKGAALGLPLAAKTGMKAFTKLHDVVAGAGAGEESLISKAFGKMEPTGKFSDQFMNRAKNLDVDQQAELVKDVTNGLNTVKNNFNTAIKDLNSTLRPAERDALIETANWKEVRAATDEVLGEINQLQKEVALHPDRYAGGMGKDLENMRVQIANNLKKQTSGGRFDLLKEIKQSAAEYGHGASPTIELQNSRELLKGLSKSINDKLINPDIFGMAGASEAAHNELLTQIYSLVSPNGRAKTALQKEFKKTFLTGDGAFDSAKIKKMLSKYGPEGDRARELLDNWFDLQHQLPEHFENTLANVPNDLWDNSKFSQVVDTLTKTHGDVGLAQTKYQEALEHAKGRKLGLRELMLGGIGVSHPLLGGAAFVMDAASRPLEYINKLAEVERIIGKATDGLAKGVKAVFSPTLKGVGKIKAPVINNMIPASPENHKKVRQDLSQLSNNPGLMIDALDNASHHLNSVAPSMADSLRQGLMRGSQFLASKLPGNVPEDPLGGSYEPSKAEISKFERYHEIVEQPYLALNQVKDGTLVPETIETLSVVYPKLFEAMKSQLMEEAIAMHSKEKAIPFQLKQNLTMFIGQPLDSALKQPSILQNQMAFAPKNAPQPVPSKSQKSKPLTIADRTSPQQDHMES
jgi:hypothetical protein